MEHLEERLAAAAPWLVAALIAAETGWLQMMQAARTGVICGLSPEQGHCAACYVAVALLAAGALAMRRRWRGEEAPSWTG